MNRKTVRGGIREENRLYYLLGGQKQEKSRDIFCGGAEDGRKKRKRYKVEGKEILSGGGAEERGEVPTETVELGVLVP